MRRIARRVAIGIGVAALAAAAFVVARIGPRNVWGMLRYDQRREGTLVVGAKAPDVAVTALEGPPKRRLGEWLGGRPAVLIFGSFT